MTPLRTISLRTRLLLFFLVASFVPLGAFGLVVRTRFLDRIETEHARVLDARVAEAERLLSERLDEDADALRALCAHDLVVERTLFQLETDRFMPQDEQSLTSVLPPLMAGRGFDALFLLQGSGDERGRVLGAAHYPGRAGARIPALVDAVSRNGTSPFRHGLRVLREGQPTSASMLLRGCVRSQGDHSILVIAGRTLDLESGAQNLVQDLSPVSFFLSTEENSPHAARTVTRFAGEPPLYLHAAIDAAPLEREVTALRRSSIYVALGAFALALLMALLLSWSLTRPLRQLEDAALRVAEGDLSTPIDTDRGDEVGAVARAFDTMMGDMKALQVRLLRTERIAAWREVARRIAHEIKNPLQPIRLEMETLRKLHQKKHPSFDDEFASSTELVLDEVSRLSRMVSEFSRFARLPRPVAARHDLSALVAQIVELHRSAGVELHVEPAPEIFARFDKDQLTQVLTNLIKNAMEAARSGRESGAVVWVKVDEAEDFALIEVEDNGPGIPSEDRVRVFEPYYTTKAGGTGLGLAIVHRIIEDHGGSIELDEGREGGAHFRAKIRIAGPPVAIEASLSEKDFPLVPPKR